MYDEIVLTLNAIVFILLLKEIIKIRKLLQESKKSIEISPLETIDGDEFYEEAKNIVIQMKKASVSLLQRKLRIGYARAATILDMLEQDEIIGPSNGSEPRKVLVSKKEQ